jgi:hypothetical protein
VDVDVQIHVGDAGLLLGVLGGAFMPRAVAQASIADAREIETAPASSARTFELERKGLLLAVGVSDDDRASPATLILIRKDHLLLVQDRLAEVL